MAPHNWEEEVVTQRLTHRQAGTQSRINFWKPQKRIGRGMENMIQWLMLCLYYYSLLYNLGICSIYITTLCYITSTYTLSTYISTLCCVTSVQQVYSACICLSVLSVN